MSGVPSELVVADILQRHLPGRPGVLEALDTKDHEAGLGAHLHDRDRRSTRIEQAPAVAGHEVVQRPGLEVAVWC